MGYIELIVVTLMIFVNAVFAGYEIALASVSKARLQHLASVSQSGAAAALSMKTGIERSLAAVQLGITLVGLIAGAASGASAQEHIAPLLQRWGMSQAMANVLAILLIVAPMTAVTIVLGELMPKLFGLRHKERVCLALSPVMRLFAFSVWPLVWFLEFAASGLMDWIDRVWNPGLLADSKMEAMELQELRAIASMARASRLIGPREENIILGAARIASRPIHEILLPAQHIHMFSLDQDMDECMSLAHQDLHTRFPVATTRGDPQSIVGYVAFKDLVAAARTQSGERSIRGIVRRIPRLPSNMAISTALELLLRERTHIAMVVHPPHQVLGMITLEDIVEELVGDIQDEHDQLPNHAQELPR
jgi:putative hemolysin